MAIWITAHSGCDGTARDSFESIELGVALGADAVEIDVRMDASGALWLSHDERSDYTGAVPLRRALERVREAGIRVNCDLKGAETLYPVLEVASEVGLDRSKLILSGSVSGAKLAEDERIGNAAQVFWNSEEVCAYWLAAHPEEEIDAALMEDLNIEAKLSPERIRAAMRSGRLDPELEQAFLRSREAHMRYLLPRANEVTRFMRERGVAALNMPYRFVSGERIAAFRSAGIPLSLWTVNDMDDFDRLCREDLLGITTMRVAEALAHMRLMNGGNEK
ncbi:MAG: glycerophosphodiester phosphodiesterase [Clostridia bacterium]|nr:glycerophosphodiester phosphodiesterase [Clostridia bacterium]